MKMTGESTSSDLMSKEAIEAGIIAEMAESSDDGSQTDDNVALDTEHQTDSEKNEDDSVDKTPTDDAGVEGDDKNKEEVKEGETVVEEEVTEEAKAKAEAEEAEKLKDEEEAELDDILGIKKSEPEDSPVWKERHSEATRTIHELNSEKKEVREFLESIGRKMVVTRDGLALVPTDDAKDFDAEDIDLNVICNSLSQDELDELTTDPIKGAVAIAKKISGAFASSVTPITARQSDSVLTDEDQRECWDGFVEAKTGNGKTMFPDAENEDVQAQMRRVYETLPNELRDLAGKSKAALSAVQEILWSRVYRRQQAKVALESSRKAKVAEQEKKNKSGLVVSGSGSETGVKAQNVDRSSETQQEREERLILEAEV